MKLLLAYIFGDRTGDGFLCCPPMQKPLAQRLKAHGGFTRPLHDSLGLAESGYLSIASRVVLLLRTSSPSAVLFAIAGIVVNSVYRMIRGRALSHVRKEAGEVMPTIADRDSSAAVSWPLRNVFIVAAIEQRSPHQVFRSSVAAMLYFWPGVVVTSDEPIRLAFNTSAFGVRPFCNSWMSATAALAKFGRMLVSHVITPLMALVRSPFGVQAPAGFAILSQESTWLG